MLLMRFEVARLCGIQNSEPGCHVRKKLPRLEMARYSPAALRTTLVIAPAK